MMRKLSRGFSMVEVMVVVAIVAILARVAIPKIIDVFPLIRVNRAANELMGDLLAVKTSAIKDGICYSVVIHTTPCNLSTAPTSPCYDIVSTTTLITKPLPPGIYFSMPVSAGNFPAPYDIIDVANAPCTFCGTTPTGTITFNNMGQSVVSCTPGSATQNGAVYIVPDIDVTRGTNYRLRRIAVVGRTGSVRVFR